jgi:hypothetical protein
VPKESQSHLTELVISYRDGRAIDRELFEGLSQSHLTDLVISCDGDIFESVMYVGEFGSQPT